MYRLSRYRASAETVLLVGLGLLFGWFMNLEGQRQILLELSEIRESDVIGFLGTIYALITAFTLVNVWAHFDNMKRVFAEENEAIIALWFNTDFLEDKTITLKMKEALLQYIDITISHEFPELAKRREIALPSPEFIRIKHVIDSIKFDDPRDPQGFEALIIAYRNLTHARNMRIENAILRVPGLLKYFYLMASLIFWLGFLIQGFSSEFLYYIVLFMGTSIVVISYKLIFDLDEPLSGLLVQSLRKYDISRNYIEKTRHKISTTPDDHELSS